MTALHLAQMDDLPRLLPLVAAFHDEMGIKSDEAMRQAALTPLLETQAVDIFTNVSLKPRNQNRPIRGR